MRARIARCGLAVLVAMLLGCHTPEGTVALGVGVAAGLGGYAPSHEIEQIYYLGVFDPREQVPPAVYRVRVRGQASLISNVKFASGWVRAELVDSLGTKLSFGTETDLLEAANSESLLAQIHTQRKLVLFGPEGFRPAPKNHRLVLVMGTSPASFFEAVDQALGSVATARAEQSRAKLDRELLQALQALRADEARLASVRDDIQTIKGSD